ASQKEYGDTAVGYVQPKRESNQCIIKCKICIEHKIKSKLYNVALIVNEMEETIISVQCHDCAASE
ncbi:hypothetical protein ILUMI_14980, partial [Ignelater luminosus]